MKADKDYLMEAVVIIETDCLPILGMVSECAPLDLEMLRWIAYNTSLNPKIRHISGKDNTMNRMLLRTQFEEEDGMVSEDEEVSVDFWQLDCQQTNKALWSCTGSKKTTTKWSDY